MWDHHPPCVSDCPSFEESVLPSSTRSSQHPCPLTPLQDAANAVAFIDKLSSLDVPHGTLGPVLRVYLKCFQTIFYTMTDLSGLGLVISISVNELDLKSQELGNQRFEE